ncbi:Hydrogenase+maturation+factor+HypB [Methylocapsa aurea]|uniref:hydrogenase nickel incorporation protein HypB n=1 Tax=Methylocapsa aurea TaxID=663610 RepID=UPI003D18E230
MCATCGCGASETTLTNLQTGERADIGDHAHAHRQADGTWRDHDHGHETIGEGDHRHAHGHDHHHHHGSDDHNHVDRDHQTEHSHPQADPQTTTIDLNARILAKNDRAAERNRAWFMGREVLALNLMSAPGAGKTTLLERTIANLKDRQKLFVLEGDQATDNDGERVKAAGAAAVQINTGAGCHLDAEMVARGVAVLKPDVGSLLFIENVGNLVCPALFSLGEHKRVAILSVTEGDDKPSKYPHMFRAAHLMLLNKIDLLAHVDFDVEHAINNAKRINPAIEVLQVSARTGDGMAAWEDWIARARHEADALA